MEVFAISAAMDEECYKYRPSWSEDMCSVKVELPPPFCGDGRKLFATWIKQFEAAAQTRGSMGRSFAATLAAVLPTRLDGAAFLLWDSLPPSVQCDFVSVKEKLNEAFGQKQFLLYFQTCVSARPRQANESLELYAADISRLVAEAFPEYDKTAQDGEKFRRFLAGLDPGLRAKCHEQGATDLEEALMVAGRCERARMALGVGAQASPYTPQTAPATVASLSSAGESGLDNTDMAGKLLCAVERITTRLDKLQMDVVDLRARRQDGYGPRRDQRSLCACDCGGIGCRSAAKEFTGGARSPQGTSSSFSTSHRGSRSPQRGRFSGEQPEWRRGVRFLSPQRRSPSPSPTGRNQGNAQ